MSKGNEAARRAQVSRKLLKVNQALIAFRDRQKVRLEAIQNVVTRYRRIPSGDEARVLQEIGRLRWADTKEQRDEANHFGI